MALEAGRLNDHESHGRFLRGDDWAEWVGTELAAALGLPAAEVRLARRAGHAGTIGRSFIEDPDTQMLVLGNVLLNERDPSYPRTRTGPLTEYTVAAVLDALPGVLPPPGSPSWCATAAEVFVGYLLLDAWIANIDRHHENWGVLESADGIRRLAPTYDHGSSLGFLLSDRDRTERLTTRDKNRTPRAWATRARSRFARTHPIEVFRGAATEEPTAAARWLDRLAGMDVDAVAEIFDSIDRDRISRASSDFAQELLRWNRRELLSHPWRTVR